jgi:hypothetical protein
MAAIERVRLLLEQAARMKESAGETPAAAKDAGIAPGTTRNTGKTGARGTASDISTTDAVETANKYKYKYMNGSTEQDTGKSKKNDSDTDIDTPGRHGRQSIPGPGSPVLDL